MTMSKQRDAAEEPKRERYRHGDLKRALVEAGTALAREGGPDAIVLREATRRAGVVPNAAYRHFASRDDLLEAVRSAALSALAGAMEAAMATEIASVSSPGGPRGKGGIPSAADIARARLRAVGAGYLRFAREETGLFRTAFTPSAAGVEHMPDPARAGPGGLNPFELLSCALDDMAKAGAMPEKQREGAEYLAWSAVHGMAMLTIDGPLRILTPEDYRALGRRLLAMVEGGLT
jgi:AcrR family transcriptional regulator